MWAWLSGTRLEVLPGFEELLESGGLTDYERLMRAEVGDRISLEAENEVRRIELGEPGATRSFFLKRSWERIPASWVLKKALRGRRQHSRAYLELTAVRELEERGYAVMRAAAWGERMERGIPTEGFLLVEGIDGVAADELWRGADRELRTRMLRDLGDLLGRLHRDGLFAFVRFKDLVCRSVPEAVDAPIDWVQIDRACSREGARRRTPARCVDALAESYVGLLKGAPLPDDDELAVLARSYLAASGDFPSGGPEALVEGIRRETARKFPREVERADAAAAPAAAGEAR